MGLDGFSMGNLGLNTELTPAQLLSQTQQSAQKEAEFKIKTISESEEDQMVKRKEEENEEKDQSFEDGLEEKNEEDEAEQEAEIPDYATPTLIDEKEIEKSNPKDFSVRINPQTEFIELYSKKDERVVETIAAKDLMGIVSKLDGASGILVNRKI